MQKRFIVLVDFSEYSANLLKYAYGWSRLIDAELLLVHKVDFVTSARLSDEKIEGLQNRTISEGIEKLKEFSYSTLPDTDADIRYKITLYNLVEAVSELLKEDYNNLVFAGLKGTGLLKKLFLGSVAVDIIEKTNALLVATPKEVERFSTEKLFVGVREEYPLNVEALRNLLLFFGQNRPAVNFFTIAKPKDNIAVIQEHLNELTKQFEYGTYPSSSIYRESNLIDQVKNIITDPTRELLVLQKGSRLLKDRLLRKFVVNELIYTGKTPLIVLP